MFNNITIMGRMVRDPELSIVCSGISMVKFTVACDRDRSEQDGTKKTDFIDCIAWRKTAEFISKYFTKGRLILLSGRLTIDSYTDKEGNKRKKAEVIVDNAYFADSKKDAESAGVSTGGFPATVESGYTPSAQQSQTGFDYPYPQKEFPLIDGDDSQLLF